jgi:branched-chain amino acid transport system ATP-binding protein
MSDSLLCVRDLTLRFGAVTAFAGVSFDVAPGELFAVIGPNGAGKSSLFNALSRVYEPCDGTVTFEGRDFLRLAPRQLAGIGIARSFQNLGVFPALTVLENVMVGMLVVLG